ncbi:MAG: hypothetical protein EPGJADBJ_03653 [Saprospiraceae bacterium]|nr:hypothetical protein [Saprospiraceae bacterium]
MKIIGNTLAIFALWLFSGETATSQDLQFSQFFQLPAATNPAYVSVPSGTRLSAGYRRQWGAVQSGLTGLMADAVMRVAQTGKPGGAVHSGLGLGVQVMQAHEPFFGYKVQEASGQVGAYVGNSESATFHLGLCGTWGQRFIDFDRMVFSGQLDPVFGISNPGAFVPPADDRVTTFTWGGGLAARGQLPVKDMQLPFGAGLALRQWTGSRNVSFAGAPGALPLARLLTAHLTVSVPLTDKYRDVTAWYLTPLMRYDWAGAQDGKKPLQRGMAGMLAQHDRVMFGGIWSFNRRPEAGQNTTALVLVLGGNAGLGGKAALTVTYNYEAPLTGLGIGATNGAHEITVVFDLPGSPVFKEKSKRGRTDCFHFAGKGFRGYLN